MKKIFLAAAIILPLSLTGCVISVGDDGDYRHHSDWEDREEKNRKSIARLEVDTKVTTIQSRMELLILTNFSVKVMIAFRCFFIAHIDETVMA
jgi:hypothetical protein